MLPEIIIETIFTLSMLEVRHPNMFLAGVNIYLVPAQLLIKAQNLTIKCNIVQKSSIDTSFYCYLKHLDVEGEAEREVENRMLDIDDDDFVRRIRQSSYRRRAKAAAGMLRFSIKL